MNGGCCDEDGDCSDVNGGCCEEDGDCCDVNGGCCDADGDCCDADGCFDDMESRYVAILPKASIMLSSFAVSRNSSARLTKVPT